MLAALYFVPSASATPHHAAAATVARTSAHAGAAASQATPQLKDLADTGAVDTKPYLIGGSAFLVVGAGLVLEAGRRSRAAL